MNGHVLSQIRAKYNTLSPSQRQVADYVLRNAEKVMTSSLSDLAGACSVSDPTVIRFLKKLDCDSYQMFRVSIAQEMSLQSEAQIYEDVKSTDGAKEIAEKVIASTARSIRDSAEVIDPGVIDGMCSRILMSRRVLVMGMGASSAPAYDLTHKLLKLGLDASFSNDAHMINIMCGNLVQGDMLIVFTHSGESREVMEGSGIAKSNGCRIAVITSYPRSGMALKADYMLNSASQETRYRSDSMTSRIIQMMIIDMIYIDLALKMGDEAMVSINRSRVAVAKNKT